ncbi:hypothetical protein E4U11_007712 [Claviceps purpurea]|nr:hypothetical protein E4U11_007712 [Claviceps purpurea]
MIGDDEFWRQLRAAEARALDAERKREADEDSSLTRYLLTCHLLDNALKVDYNGSSTGSQTQARYAAGRACLLQIVPWKDFPTEILAVLDELSLSSIFHEHFSATVPDEMWAWNLHFMSSTGLHLTSVAQVFAFTILALQSPAPDEDWIDAILALGTWDVACDVMLAEIPEMDRQKPCHKADAPKRGNQCYRHSPFSTLAEDFQSMDDHPYCTHECLRGLAFGGSLDEKCPNAKDHGTEHIDREEFLRLVREQLEASPRINAECFPLNASGSVASLLKIRLLSHGYTLVAKAFSKYDRDNMCYEEKTYKLLRDLQGDYIPVCPGHIVLSRAMYYAHYERSNFRQFLLLSYGGRPVLHALSKVEEAITNQILTALAQLHKYRVLHHDAEPRNILYDERTGEYMVVDLERSESRTEIEIQSHDLVRKRDDVRFAAEANSLLASLTSVEAC